jgi:putative tryptophan/tyrosine transport system substrate-binding protein
MGYRARISSLHRRLGVCAARIFNGDEPADLPVGQSAKFEFVIDVKTAKALDLAIPAALPAIANEVVQ